MEPQDPGAGWAAGGGHLRASDAERELVIDALKAAFVEGRLSRSELARRAGQALESRTYAELAAAAAGIAAGRAAAAPPRPPAAPVRARAVSGKVIAWAVSVLIVSPALGVAFFATYWGSFFILLLLAYRRGGRARHARAAVSSPATACSAAAAAAGIRAARPSHASVRQPSMIWPPGLEANLTPAVSAPRFTGYART